MYVLKLLDRYSVAIPISVACLAEITVFAYYYGKTIFLVVNSKDKDLVAGIVAGGG